MKAFSSILALVAALALVACGNGSSRESGRATAVSATAPREPTVTVPQGPPPEKLVIDDPKKGSGPLAKPGDQVTVQYVGVEYQNGKKLDSSWDRDEPFAFQLGSGAVIPGWEEGVAGMKVGGRRKLIVPSRLAYGSGALIFVIDLVGINEAEAEDPSRVGRPKPKITVPDGPPPREVVVDDIDEGSGPVLKAGDEMAVDYVGVNYKTGREFESTWEKGEPSKFTFGRGEVVKGWEFGLKGMRVGGRRELIVPSRFAYKTGALIYVIDLIGVE